MYLLGWSPGTFDIEHPLRFLAATPNPEAKLGTWNFGGYSNPRVDALLPLIRQAKDARERTGHVEEVLRLLQDDVAYVPLHVPPLLWASKSAIELVQRPDDFFTLRWVTVG
jgi:peptide/nickel transport system substrate-binding protein